MAGVDGLVSGIDTGSIVSGIMAAARRPLAKLQEQFDQLSAQRSAMQEFNTLLGELQTAVEAMDTASEATAYSLSSSQPDKIDATVSGDPAPGMYSVRVDHTALNTVRRSQGLSSPTKQLRKGNLKLTIGGQVTNVPIQTANGTRTIEGIADYVNDNVTGVRAYVLNTGSGSSPYRLMLESEETGTNNALSTQVSHQGGSGTKLNISSAQSARDARLVVSNTTVYTQSNQPVDVIPGLTFDIKAATTGDAQITVGRDAQQTADNVQGVVDAYNELSSFMNRQAGSSASEGGPLAGDSTMRTINRRIQSVLNTAGGFGTISGMNAIGLGSAQTGDLEFDAAAFKTALLNNPGDVMSTLTGPNGLFGELAAELDVIGDPVTGLIQPRIESFDTRMTDLTDRVEQTEERLITYEETIRAQFVAMELAIARYDSTSSFLDQQLAQWNKQS
jgi:flagellar hook-associated protein 2